MPSWNESTWFATLVLLALKSTTALGVAWLIAQSLRGRSAAARHLVWTAAAAAVVALPFLSISLPALAVPGSSAFAPDVLFRTTATATADTVIAQAPQLQAISRGVAPSAPRLPAWRLSLMLLWVAGSGIALAQMLLACCGMWRVRRAAKPSPQGRLSHELARELGIRRAVDVFDTAIGTMPMTFGILRPAVFMPANSVEWTEERRRIVLLHELAHVRRGDVATQLLARLALVLNWWNPLSWIAWREFLKERERATDDLVLHAGARASDYSGHLLEVARAMRPAQGWAAVAMARRSELEGRLLAILDSRVNRKIPGHAAVVVAALIGVGLVAPFAAVRAQDSASPALQADVDATIRAGIAQKNHEILDRAAAAFESRQQYDTAQRLLESAVAIREQVSGDKSVEYGLGLLKLAELEKKRHRGKEAEAFYTKALQVLGDRPETAPALLILGLTTKNTVEAMNYLQRAQRSDPSHAGQAMMWMAVIREREPNPTEAEALYKSSLAALNPASAEAANALRLYARFLGRQSRYDELQVVLMRLAATLQSMAPAQGSSTTAFRVGGGVTAPSLLSKVEPEYSFEARAAKYEGTVGVAVEVLPDGTASAIRIVKSVGLGLDEQAIAAIKQWRFRPGMKDGVPVTVAANIEVNFRVL